MIPLVSFASLLIGTNLIQNNELKKSLKKRNNFNYKTCHPLILFSKHVLKFLLIIGPPLIIIYYIFGESLPMCDASFFRKYSEGGYRGLYRYPLCLGLFINNETITLDIKYF